MPIKGSDSSALFNTVVVSLGILVHFRAQHFRKNVDRLGRVQHIATKMIMGHEGKARGNPGLYNLEKRRLGGMYLISVSKYLKGEHREDGEVLFSVVTGDRTGNNGLKL